MNLSKIIQIKFYPSDKMSLTPRGVSGSGNSLSLARQLTEMQIYDDNIYLLTKYVDYIAHINIDSIANNTDWGFIKLVRREEGMSMSEYRAIFGKIPPLTQHFDIKDGNILACSPIDTEIDFLVINPKSPLP